MNDPETKRLIKTLTDATNEVRTNRALAYPMVTARMFVAVLKSITKQRGGPTTREQKVEMLHSNGFTNVEINDHLPTVICLMAEIIASYPEALVAIVDQEVKGK